MSAIMHPNDKSATPKPTSAVALALAKIPKSLKSLDRWILWRYTLLPNGNWTKTPHGPGHGRKIDATDFANGASFEIAVQALRKNKGKFDGLGFLLGEGIAGIDVDDCIDDDGNLDERGQAVSSQYSATYAEVSPSGRGFKLLVDIGDDPKLAVIGKNTKEMEIYGGKRYFTVTGAKLAGHADVIAPMAEAFAATAATLGINKPAPVADMPTERPQHALGIDLIVARELLDHLPFKWCDEYEAWYQGGMALHHEFNGSMEALMLWDEYSQRSEKYADGVCAAKWRTFGKPGKKLITIRTLIADAQATGWRAPATIESAIADFTVFDEPEPTVDDDGVLSEPPTWWQKYSVGDLLRIPAPEKKWVWKGILRQGKVLVLAGSGGSSKSYLMLAASIQYALRNDWGPFEAADEAGKVLLLYGEEDKEDVHDRIQSLKFAFMLTDDQVATVAERVAVLPLRGSNIELAKLNGDDVVMTEQLERLESKIVEYGVKLVVMDPLALLHSLEENDNRAIAAFVSGLDSVCMRTGASIVLVHHFGKGGSLLAREVNESNVRGASSLAAHARTVVVMHRLRRDEASSWGVQEDDHSKWVMFNVTKNNYGKPGQISWFEVNSLNGAIMPSQTQLQYLNVRDIREAARVHAEEEVETDISNREFRRAQEAAEAENLKTRHIQILLRYAEGHGLPSKKKCHDILKAILPETSGLSASNANSYVRDNHLVDTDGLMNTSGLDWLEAHAILE